MNCFLYALNRQIIFIYYVNLTIYQGGINGKGNNNLKQKIATSKEGKLFLWFQIGTLNKKYNTFAVPTWDQKK